MLIPPNPTQRAGRNVTEICKALLQVLDAAPVDEKDKLAILGAVAAQRGGMIVKFRLEQAPTPDVCHACRNVQWANLGERCQIHSDRPGIA